MVSALRSTNSKDIKYYAKGFFSEISILNNKWLFFNFRGSQTSSILSNSCSFLRYAFLGLKIMMFEKNPFTTAVSIPKSFHLTPFSPTFEILQPTLVEYSQGVDFGVTSYHRNLKISVFGSFRVNLLELICFKKI